jgi:hypothetical protein
VSESRNWSEREDLSDRADALAVADQMKAATRSLRARLSLVRDPEDHGPAQQPPSS